MMNKWERAAHNIAYGKPKRVKQLPRTSDTLVNIGVRFYQLTRIRPEVWAYEKGKKAWKVKK